MTLQAEAGLGLIEALNGSHLHWTDFRENVLRSFQIQCSPSPKSDRLPTTFLARLEASQKTLPKYGAQKEAWRVDVAAGRGFSTNAIFPPNLLPPTLDTSSVLRCMAPRMGREDLPLRNPSLKEFLYELPTAKPIYMCGFDASVFEKLEHMQLTGSLSVAGTAVDFSRGEVLPGSTICCPFLAFDKFKTKAKEDIEAARNSCAITGAQCLRSQQQLFHKAYGLQIVSQPPITFTCALNDEYAVINCHYVDDDGAYTMAALCRFDLDTDDHFLEFHAWIEAIESWASLYLLPRLKGAINQVLRSNLSPPPSPTPTANSPLSIDTNSDSGLLAVVADLRRGWPMTRWQINGMGETPINSSIAQCGTPLNTRQMRGLALPRPVSDDSLLSPNDGIDQIRPHSSLSQRMSDALTPLQTNLTLAAQPRSSIHQRRFFSAGSVTSPESDGPGTPYSACRPSTLSPCTPSPEAPVSSKSPMLVLQKRLDLAMDEIQGLRTQVDDLQAQLNGRTEVLERRLELVLERQEADRLIEDGDKARTTSSTLIKQLEVLAEEELKTPTARRSLRNAEEQAMDVGPQFPSPTQMEIQVPGLFPDSDGHAEAWESPWRTEDFIIWCLALFLRDAKVKLAASTIGALLIFYLGNFDVRDFCVNLAVVLAFEDSTKAAFAHAQRRAGALYEAAQACDL